MDFAKRRASQQRTWQVDAMLTQKYRGDHILAKETAPVALLTNDHDHAAPKKLAESEALPNNGEAAGGCTGLA
ncbi:hypothetical protein MNEG_3410 [Monoraphidium neglectum]|uniref:Uncharacterized protein n=1 Tax=Monoraphidium neglectum TaxID=145388 RepID=A0A0D2K1U7_9CHLO|nr:hypothetical protein MNEG_3410 [Monoraphidium neglectum]KIZ04548.1 hypothetical protein MNEG_3410 [Monoraphidium neglectum]|eukprot:XP_013903567.1 hypothetical protein MNEG_3410 [Monoraphidium neglectum]